ncbi:hypothetical protein [Undibacterium sp. Di24W]|uniref:hypothetical protein n=1 Tax=Undibacterium sp. Di24W TaxID=3413033 RepID=UPI003BEFFF08
MTRKIILLLCGLGILFYVYKIYLLKDTITLFPSAKSVAVSMPAKGTSGPSMRLKFTLETDSVDTMASCRKLFDQADDIAKISAHPKEEGKAILNVERLFPASELQTTLALNKVLKEQGCLKGERDVFALETVQ